MKLYDVKKETEKVLAECKSARDNDFVLYNEIATNLGFNGIAHIQVQELLELIYCGALPTIESVSRTRRKLQEQNEEYIGTKTAQERRHKSEDEYREFFGHYTK